MTTDGWMLRMLEFGDREPSKEGVFCGQEPNELESPSEKSSAFISRPLVPKLVLTANLWGEGLSACTCRPSYPHILLWLSSSKQHKPLPPTLSDQKWQLTTLFLNRFYIFSASYFAQTFLYLFMCVIHLHQSCSSSPPSFRWARAHCGLARRCWCTRPHPCAASWWPRTWTGSPPRWTGRTCKESVCRCSLRSDILLPVSEKHDVRPGETTWICGGG